MGGSIVSPMNTTLERELYSAVASRIRGQLSLEAGKTIGVLHFGGSLIWISNITWGLHPFVDRRPKEQSAP